MIILVAGATLFIWTDCLGFWGGRRKGSFPKSHSSKLLTMVDIFRIITNPSMLYECMVSALRSASAVIKGVG